MSQEEALAPFHIGFIGPSGSGKTTLIEGLLPLFAAAGFRVGVVKHTHHRAVNDAPGKDSWRFDRAGAHRVLLVTPERIYFQHAAGLEVACDPDLLLAGCDIVIHEGGRGLAHAKVLVGETLAESAARETGGEPLLLVGAPDGVLPSFGRDEHAAVAAFLVHHVAGERAPEAVTSA